MHEPLLQTFRLVDGYFKHAAAPSPHPACTHASHPSCRNLKAYDRKIRKAKAKLNLELATRLKNVKPGYKVDHLVKERCGQRGRCRGDRLQGYRAANGEARPQNKCRAAP